MHRPGQNEIRLKTIAIIHNFNLFLLSAVIFLGALYEVVSRIYSTSVLDTYCDPHRRNHIGGLFFWCYVFYLSKFYEWGDTILLVLRKKGLNFLHVFHHFIVPILFWSYMDTQTPSQVILVLANTLVHTFMYYYYLMCELKVNVWWKEYLTMLQIIQFMCDILASYPHLILKYVWKMDCAVAVWTIWFGQLIGAIFIYLFASYFRTAYRKSKKQ